MDRSALRSHLTTVPALPPARAWTATQVGALAAAVAIGIAVTWFSRLAELTTGGDESLYLLLSRSLAQGHYQDEYLPHSPPHAHFPPGMPAWLLLVRTLAGPSLDAARAANLFAVVAAGLLVADGFRRIGQTWIGIGAVALVWWNPKIAQITMTLHAEAPFILFSVVAAWAALRADQSARLGWPLLATIAAIAAFLTRSAGLGVIAGIGLWFLTTRRWLLVAGYATASGGAVLGWFSYLRSATAQTIATTYADDIEEATSGLAVMVRRMVEGAEHYLGTAVPDILSLPMIPGTPLDNLAWLLLLGACGTAGLVLLARQWSGAAAVLTAGAGILLLYLWKVDRLVLPLLPWLTACVLLGALWWWRLLRPADPRSVPVVALWALLAGCALAGSIEQFRKARGCGGADQYAFPGCVAEEERQYMHLIRAVQELVPPDAVVATTKPSLLAYASGVRSVPLLRGLDDPRVPRRVDWLASHGGATHVLITRFSDMEKGRAIVLLHETCAGYDLVRSWEGGAVLLRIVPAGEGPGDACPTLRAIEPVEDPEDAAAPPGA